MTSETKPNRLRNTREQCGLSLGQAAKRLGWAQGPLYAMEIGAGSPPTDDDLRALAKVYGCSVAWLRGETAELSAENEALLRDVEHTGDRAVVREFMQMLSTVDPGAPPAPTMTERIAKVRAKHESPAAAVPTASKRSYVKRQRQTRDHHCHWPGCTTPVPPAMWGCKAHWFKLPKALRDRIWAAYAPGQEVDMTPSAEYLQVADDVQQWIRANAAGAPR